MVFTTSNNSFGPTEISYLENRFCKMSLVANRYEVKNGNDPTLGNITEEKESELEEFIDYAKIVMGTLGHKIFEPIDAAPVQPTAVAPKEDEPLLYLHTGKAKATGKRTSDGFVVYANSVVSLTPTKSCPEAIIKRRESLSGKIDVEGVLTENTLFGSPSTAAAFVTFGSANGNIIWKTAEGHTLKDVERSES